MKFNLEKIIGKNIHCDTEEKASELLKFLHENGFKWNSGTDLIRENYWKGYAQNTYYRISNCNYGAISCKAVNFGSIKIKNVDSYIEFEDVIERGGGNQMYHNLVFINHYAGKNYLFKLPLNIKLNTGQEVFVDTIQGQTMGKCVTDSFIVDDYTKNQIVAGNGAYEPLKEVAGLAKKQEGYKCIDFRFIDVPF